jgi:hypothetical protein
VKAKFYNLENLKLLNQQIIKLTLLNNKTQNLKVKEKNKKILVKKSVSRK